MPGWAALSAVPRSARSATTKSPLAPGEALGDGCHVRDDLRARDAEREVPVGPADAATAGDAMTLSGCPSLGCRGRKRVATDSLSVPVRTAPAPRLHLRLDAVDGQPVVVGELDVAAGRSCGERAEGQAVDHEGRAFPAAFLDLHRRRDRQGDDPAAPGLLGNGDAKDVASLVVGAPQLELDEVALLGLDAHHQHGGRALGGELERRRVRREHRAPRRSVPLRLDPRGQCLLRRARKSRCASPSAPGSRPRRGRAR